MVSNEVIRISIIFLSPLLLLLASRGVLWPLARLAQRWWPGFVTPELKKAFFPSFDIMMILLGVDLFVPVNETLHRLAIASMIIAGLWNIDVILKATKKYLSQQFTQQITDEFQMRKIQTQTQFIIKIGRVVMWVMGVGFSLTNFPQIKILGSSLIASAGIASVILGLAAQKTIINFIAGLQISFTQPIKIDDVVIVEGEWGKIEEIALTYVVVRIWDGRRLILPITYFIDRPFENWTRDSKDILGAIIIYTDYRLPVAALREEFLQMVARHPRWDGKVASLQVVDVTEKSLKIRALVSAPDASTAWDLRCDLREQLIAHLQLKYPSALPGYRIHQES